MVLREESLTEVCGLPENLRQVVAADSISTTAGPLFIAVDTRIAVPAPEQECGQGRDSAVKLLSYLQVQALDPEYAEEDFASFLARHSGLSSSAVARLVTPAAYGQYSNAIHVLRQILCYGLNEPDSLHQYEQAVDELTVLPGKASMATQVR